MTLGDLIAALEKEDPEMILPLGFSRPHSYRGYYDQLAFEPCHDIRVREMLACAKEALGETYTGYKGGEYKMDEYTPCNLSKYGTTGEEIGEYFLGLMLDAGRKEPR